LPRLLEDVVLSKRSRIYYQYGWVLRHCSRQLGISWFAVWRWQREMHCLAAHWMPQTASQTVSGSCNEQLAQFTTERQPVLRQAVAFSKTTSKLR
jgi:hypothetical protein